MQEKRYFISNLILRICSMVAIAIALHNYTNDNLTRAICYAVAATLLFVLLFLQEIEEKL